jgi:5-methyltetrahydrofolate--homocysteine methyltransferase
MKPSVASLYQAVELAQDIRPLVIGERTNANGSRQFRERLLADDYQGCLTIGIEQETSGAHVLDVCAAYAGRDELKDMVELVRLFAGSVRIPIMIDSTTPAVIEACLKLYPGRCIVNSINLEDGGVNLRKVCALVKKYGAAVVALTIGPKGMAMTTDEKVSIARAIHDIAVGEFGLRPQDILFDPLTFTIGAGDETLRDAAVQTLDAIRRIKAEIPGVFTLLGLSNISFGLSPRSRRILNSVFLHEALQAGLDAAIIDAGKIVPFSSVTEPDREVCLSLLYDRRRDEQHNPLTAFIDYFAAAEGKGGPASGDKGAGGGEDLRLPQQVLFDMVVDGRRDGLEDQLSILLQRVTPMGLVNRILVPAMRHVGELFGRGDILLPFVLKSAEVMKAAVSFLEPLMDHTEAARVTRVVLATVQGDVHDIGKNLVDIILTNNGYKVYNLGIKVPAETIIEKAREVEADIIGLSGLLVKSAIIMQESMPQYRAAGLKAPILLGGAALTAKFVAEGCVPAYPGGPVVYCEDAFAGLKAVQAWEQGRLEPTRYDATVQPQAMKPGMKNVDIARDNQVPTAPFFGLRHVRNIDPAALFSLVNEQALFRGRWGYRRGRLGAEEYARLIEDEVRPLYRTFQRRAIEERLVEPRVAYGWFHCWSEGETLYVQDGDVVHDFAFPRQSEPPHLCIADFYKTRAEGGDVAGFFVVTIGERMGEATHALYNSNSYHDYVMLHGFSVEVTDALAEYWHEVMRRELGFGDDRPASLTGYATQEYRGSRYGFGYPACPDLGAHRAVFAMLKPEVIGVTLTESMEMVPEQTTSAIVAHHPQAKYFAV